MASDLSQHAAALAFRVTVKQRNFFLTFQRNLKKKEVDFIEWWIVLLASYAVNTISYINVCLASVLFKLHSPNLLKLCCMENLIK